MRPSISWLAVLSACEGDGDATDDGGEPSECGILEALTEPLATDCSAFDVPSCGGDPIGSWTRLAACGYGGALPTATTYTGGACAGDSIRIAYDVTGSLDVFGDGTIEQDVVVVQTIDWTIPEACLTQLDIVDCDAFATDYEMESCEAAEGGGCVCGFDTETLTAHASGLWDTCDGRLTVSDARGTLVATYGGTSTTTSTATNPESTTADYCVDGDTLWLADELRQTYSIYVRF